LITLGLLLCAAPAVFALQVVGLSATFNSAADIPVTAASYTAAGDATFTLGFAPTPGTNLTVVKNTGLPFISGQFSNLANGATVNLTYSGTTYPFVAWYYGGEGNNDLVLLWPYTGMAAWGPNLSGQLGDNSQTTRLAPVAVELTGALRGKTVVQVARGGYHTLALCSDGTIAAWGDNGSGQLGNNTFMRSFVPVAVYVSTGSYLNGKSVVAIDAGNSHSLALCSDGTLAAWGENSRGQLGVASGSDRFNVPTAVTAWTGALLSKTVVRMAAGAYHCLALCSDGTLAAWGENFHGKLGNNSTTDSTFPVAVNVAAGTSALSGKNVIDIAAGGMHSLALCSDGTVAAWGSNFFGSVGDNSTTNRLVPVAVNTTVGTSALSGKTVVDIAAAQAHSLVLCSDGTLVTWGSNESGVLGDNSTTDSRVPVAVNTQAGTSALFGKSVVSIAVTSISNLVLCSDGTLAAWGYNVTGELGDNSTTSSSVPVVVNREPGTSALAVTEVRGLANGSSGTFCNVLFGYVPTPEIAVLGNGVEIGQGDVTPSTADFTDFGNVPLIPGQLSQTFTIASVGNVALNLTGTPRVSLSGPGAAAFAVSLAPEDTVPADGSTRFAITFDPTLPALYTATVTIQSDAVNHPSFSFAIRGFGALNAALKQTITFNPPATAYLGQNPLSLDVYSSSGLPVTLRVVPQGTTTPGASIVGNVLSFTGVGSVKVQAEQAGDAFYGLAAPVVKTITVKADPVPLTLLNLSQIYTGTPRAISTLGGSGTVTIEYKIGTTFGSTQPTNAGSYPVRATDSTGPKTGTLVIAKAPLYVTPGDKRRFVGQDNPALTLSYSGWVNGESSSLVLTAPTLKTTATKTSPGGIYPITATGGSALANYTHIYQQGALVVESFAGNYEALLTNSGGALIGKLTVNIVAANTSFTGKLTCIDEKTAVPLKGSLPLFDVGTESITGNAFTASGGVPYEVDFTMQINGGLSAIVERSGSAYASSTDGRRLLNLPASKTVTYAGAHTAVLEPATPTANTVPAGAGWATAAVSTKGVMTLTGRLGDGTSFTTALPPDEASDPTYRLFLQPYKTGAATRLQSHFGGAFTLLPRPALAGRRYVESAALTWAKPGLSTDESYRAGFGTVTPVRNVLLLDPWLPPAAAKGSTPAVSLATRLGLTSPSFQVLHSATGSTLNGNLPTLASLSATNTVAVTTPPANPTKWKTTLVSATGLFSGSFELADTTPKPRVVNFSGVLRQPATAPDTLIGDGHYLLPPFTGTEKTTGEVMFLRP
jgi:alpha-tubulin suppressor-like RCC1 family protein